MKAYETRILLLSKTDTREERIKQLDYEGLKGWHIVAVLPFENGLEYHLQRAITEDALFTKPS